MNVEIITIGDELLIGQVVDTNSVWMGKTLNEAGFNISQKTVISDNKEQIINSLDEALKRVDIVLVTGGLGPTKDDVTKEALCDYFDTTLEFDQIVYNDIKAFLNHRSTEIIELNKTQAMVPRACAIIRNTVGTAPIMWFKNRNKSVISMPGVPIEMKTAMTNYIIPKLSKEFKKSHILHKTLSVYGLPESELAERIKEWEAQLPSYMTLAYLPSPGKVKLRLTGRGIFIDVMENDMFSLLKDLRGIIGEYIQEDASIEELLGNILRQRGETVSTAESCTGGYIGHKLTINSGSSDFYLGGTIAYANSVKISVLGVLEGDILAHGAVSKEVVEQMALGAKKITGSTWSIATSGVAGPNGGTEEKPVGTVWFAWAGPTGVKSKKLNLGNVRENNIIRAAEEAILEMYKIIKGLN